METKPNPLRDKSYQFARNILVLTKTLMKEGNEYEIARQLRKSGTSVGANIVEALQGQSKKDFISKLSISLKEACESRYWLNLLVDSKIGEPKGTVQLLKDSEELIRLLTSIIKTSKNNS